MAKPLPNLDVPVLTANGYMNQAWFEYFQSLQSSVGGLLNAPPAPSFTVTPLTPGSTSATTTARTVNASNNTPFAGTDPGTSTVAIGYAGAGTSLYDSFLVVANCITALFTNTTNLKNSVTALDTRVLALENKENDVISDLDVRFP